MRYQSPRPGRGAGLAGAVAVVVVLGTPGVLVVAGFFSGAAPAAIALASVQQATPEPDAGDPAFAPTIGRIGPAMRRRIRGSSWHRGCPVGLDDLRLLRLGYIGFDGISHRGRLVVHEDEATAVLKAMRSLYERRFPIHRMRLVDAYGADDDRSMAADNTSAFNCRRVAGTTRWSQHAYGRAIDINPVENPWVSGDRVSPPAGERFVDRSRQDKGMIHGGDATVRAFLEQGWEWGGSWASPKDYQHFSSTGR